MAEGESDPFEEALKAINEEQEGTTAEPTAANEVSPEESQSLDLDKQPNTAVSIPEEKQSAISLDGSAIDLDFLLDIKLKVTFEVGRSKMLISDLLTLGQGSVIELNRLVGENLNILVNGHLLATGEVVVINEHFGARIAEIVSPEERIKRMGS